MSDTFDHSGLPEDELLAAEYALGVLDGIDRATAEQRIARDRSFARQVAAWEERLAPWAAEIPDMLPAPHVWDRIAAALPAAGPPAQFVAEPRILAGPELCGRRARRSLHRRAGLLRCAHAN